VLQRLLENLQISLVDVIAQRVQKDALVMATNQYACRVLQSILNRCSAENKKALYETLLPDVEELLLDNFGCYVLQKLIETMDCKDLKKLVNEILLPRYFDVSVHKYACRVMQDVFRYFKHESKTALEEKVLESVLGLCQNN